MPLNRSRDSVLRNLDFMFALDLQRSAGNF
jgi:hypothetical protein